MFIYSRNRRKNALIRVIKLLIWLVILLWAYKAVSGHFKKPKALTLPDCKNSYCNEWILKLADCESSNRWWIRIIDTNSKMSYGGLQFQLDTFREWGVRSGILPKGISTSTAEELIMHKELSSRVALYMRDQGVEDRHWVVCYKKIKNHERKIGKTDQARSQEKDL